MVYNIELYQYFISFLPQARFEYITIQHCCCSCYIFVYVCVHECARMQDCKEAGACINLFLYIRGKRSSKE